MLGCNGGDSGVVLRCESMLTSDWSFITITYEEVCIKEKANHERYYEI